MSAIDPALFQENERLDPTADERQYFDAGPIALEAGGELSGATLAYETWGELDAARDNAILVCHALSGDAHATGWWDRLVGPGKAIDTQRYFVVGSNTLGGCQGSTGPASLAPDGKPFGSRFPIITIGDMVELQRRLMEHLGVTRLHGVAGGSMGGMQALEWTVRFPGWVKRAAITASAAAHGAMQIGFNEAARQAVMRDPGWNQGDYQPGEGPDHGLAVARIIGHLGYLSEDSFDRKFGRRFQNKDAPDYHLGVEFEVESYLNYQGDKFTRRFDANSLLVLTRAIDYYDCRSLQGSTTEYLFTSFTSDWLYPSHQSRTMHEMALAAGCSSVWHDIENPLGHDAFLLDGEVQGELIREFFARP